MSIRTTLLAALLTLGAASGAFAMCDGQTAHQAKAPIVTTQDGASS